MYAAHMKEEAFVKKKEKQIATAILKAWSSAREDTATMQDMAGAVVEDTVHGLVRMAWGAPWQANEESEYISSEKESTLEITLHYSSEEPSAPRKGGKKKPKSEVRGSSPNPTLTAHATLLIVMASATV